MELLKAQKRGGGKLDKEKTLLHRILELESDWHTLGNEIDDNAYKLDDMEQRLEEIEESLQFVNDLKIIFKKLSKS